MIVLNLHFFFYFFVIGFGDTWGFQEKNDKCRQI